MKNNTLSFFFMGSCCGCMFTENVLTKECVNTSWFTFTVLTIVKLGHFHRMNKANSMINRNVKACLEAQIL